MPVNKSAFSHLQTTSDSLPGGPDYRMSLLVLFSISVNLRISKVV
jgi:hypothetical protein